jgi:hypothetical protein
MATENYILSINGMTGSSYNQVDLCFQSAGLSSTDTLDGAGDLVNAFIAHAQTLWLAMLPGSYNLNSLSARRAFPKPSASAVSQNQAFANGGALGASSTGLSLCPSIFLVPPMGIKSGGKIFLPAVGQSEIVDNTYSGAFVTAVDAFMTAVTAGLAGSGRLGASPFAVRIYHAREPSNIRFTLRACGVRPARVHDRR